MKNFNDIIPNYVNDISFLAYAQTCEKVEKAIADGDNEKLEIYLTSLRSQEDNLVKIFRYRLSQKYSYIEAILDIEKKVDNIGEQINHMSESYDEWNELHRKAAILDGTK
ncbi:hypothetical protein [Lacrimispora brassicae]